MKAIILALLPTIFLWSGDDPLVKVPKGYVLQKLDATDGLIARPSDWFYGNHGTASGWVWTISKEDPKKGAFETGFTIQMIIGLESKTKQSRQEFCTNFINSKRKSLKVFKECPVIDMGTFMRQCIEVLEIIPESASKKEFHVLYSVMWMKNMDIAAVTTFGASDADWESIVPITQVMSEFRLIGPDLGK